LLCWAGTVTASTPPTLSISTAMGGIGRPSNRLHLGLEPVVIIDTNRLTPIGNPDQDHTAGGIGKGADLPPLWCSTMSPFISL